MGWFSKSREMVYLLFAVGFFIFTKHWENGLGVSSTTYGAMARNIVESGNWLRVYLAPHFFDPFVGHPPLVIWLDSIIFMIFGESPQSMRLLSIASAFLVFFSVFRISQKVWDTRVAVLSCLMILLISKFMNFTTSGWLDLPMIAFTWVAYYCFFCSESRLRFPLVGLFLAAAFLSKGFSALGIIPLGLYIVFSGQIKMKQRLVFLLFSFTPLIIFSVLYYQANGLFFWQEYIIDELNINHQLAKDGMNYTWYFLGLFKHGHIVVLVGLISMFLHRGERGRLLKHFAWITIVLHAVAYSTSSRTYDQYLLPCFPWFAVFAAHLAAQYFNRFSPLKFSRFVFAVSILFFTVVGFSPIKVHSTSGEYLQGFAQVLESEQEVYFLGEYEEQMTWEFMSSYIVWYLRKTPRLIRIEKFKEDLVNGEVNYSLLLSQNYFDQFDFSQFPRVEICGHNIGYKLIVKKGTCQENLLIPPVYN